MSRGSKNWLALVMATALLVTGVASSGCSVINRGTQIETATAEKVDLSVSVTASGKVEAGRRADVYPPTAGTLSVIYVKEGQKVSAGDKLAMMDLGPLEIAVDQARAGVAAANAQLETINNQAPGAADYDAANANVSAAKAAYNASLVAYNAVDDQAPSAQAEKAANSAVAASLVAYNNAVWSMNLAYTVWQSSPSSMTLEAAYRSAQTGSAQAKAAWESSKSSQQSLENTDLSSAKAQAYAATKQSYAGYKTAVANEDKLCRTSLSAQRDAARMSRRQAQKSLAVAQKTLDDATMVAPIDGTVFFNASGAVPQADGQTQEPAEGAGVAPQAPPFSVVDLGGSTFVAEVDEADIARVKPGMNATIQFDAFPDKSVKTTVTSVQPAARQTATGGTVFPVDLSLADIDMDLLIGMKGDADVKVKSIPTAIVIPIEALQDENGQTYVFLVEGGTKLKKTDVKTGASTDTQVQILDGLKEGDVVALSGSTTLTDGMTVRVKK